MNISVKYIIKGQVGPMCRYEKMQCVFSEDIIAGPLLCIGIRDKHGRDIYEGDIIFIDHPKWNKSVYIKWNEDSASFTLNDLDGNFVHSILNKEFFEVHVTVKGNINTYPTISKN